MLLDVRVSDILFFIHYETICNWFDGSSLDAMCHDGMPLDKES